MKHTAKILTTCVLVIILFGACGAANIPLLVTGMGQYPGAQVVGNASQSDALDYSQVASSDDEIPNDYQDQVDAFQDQNVDLSAGGLDTNQAQDAKDTPPETDADNQMSTDTTATYPVTMSKACDEEGAVQTVMHAVNDQDAGLIVSASEAEEALSVKMFQIPDRVSDLGWSALSDDDTLFLSREIIQELDFAFVNIIERHKLYYQGAVYTCLPDSMNQGNTWQAVDNRQGEKTLLVNLLTREGKRQYYHMTLSKRSTFNLSSALVLLAEGRLMLSVVEAGDVVVDSSLVLAVTKQSIVDQDEIGVESTSDFSGKFDALNVRDMASPHVRKQPLKELTAGNH